jgi:hypothetical protein
MSLTIYDKEKGCIVLNPAYFKPAINAFHKDYIKTYHPDLIVEMRTESRQTRAGQTLSKHVEKMRETKPTHGTMFGISDSAVSVEPKQMMKRSKK